MAGPEDEPRDYHGKWTTGGASHADKVGEKVPAQVELHPEALKRLAALKPGEGGSVHAKTGENPHDRYMVSLAGRSQIFEAGHTPTAKDYQDYAKKNADQLGKGENHIGIWRDPAGATFLDVSKSMKDRNAAVMTGRKNNQQSIFDLKKMREIPTGGTGR